MSIEEDTPAGDQPAKTGRRKFDDVASLFGSIVPPAGTPVPPQVMLRPLPSPSGIPSGSSVLPIPPPSDRTTPPSDKAQPLGPKPPPAELTMAPPNPTVEPAPVDLREPQKLPPRPQSSLQDTLSQPPPPPPRGKRKQGGGTAAPWPDAFQPQPNWRKTAGGRSWSWLLLVPLAGVVAYLATAVDPRTVREWVDRNVMHRAPATSSVDTTLLPPAFRNTPQAPPPNSLPPPGDLAPQSPAPSAPAQPPESAPAATVSPSVPTTPAPSVPEPPAVAPTTPSLAPAPTPSTSGSAAPVPPMTADQTPSTPSTTASAAPIATAGPLPLPPVPPVTPPPSAAPPPSPAGTSPLDAVAPTQAATSDPAASAPAAPRISRVVIHFRRNQQGAEAEANRIAAAIGGSVGAVETRATTAVVRSALVTYGAPGDRDIAATLARNLASDGVGSWIVRAGTTRLPAGQLDVWVP